MRVKPPRLKESYSTQVNPIRWAKCMMVQQPWTGWSRNKSEALRLRLPPRLVSGLECLNNTPGTVLTLLIPQDTLTLLLKRSEERRVGKECRSRWSQEQ